MIARRRARAAFLVLAVLGLVACDGGARDDAAPAGEQRASIPAPGGAQEVWCSGQGPAVVLVTGIGDEASSAQWHDVQRGLAPPARVCRYDRPGTGESSPPSEAGRGADALDHELDLVVEHAAGDGDVVLVAHSFGGYLARVYAHRHPERIRGVVFVDALDPSVGLVRGTGAASLDEVAMAGEQLDLGQVEAAARAVSSLPDDPPLVVLTRGRDVSSAWAEGQARIAELSERAETRTVSGSGHQVPSDAPNAVMAAVESLLEDQSGEPATDS